ncbi:MAG: enoyl-ACP reductase [Vicinamibacteria bacterium]
MLLEGKNGLILGVANKRSIAWGIARACAREGARLALTYQGERLKENVDELSKGLQDPLLYPCDVSKDEDIAALAASVKADLGSLDFVVHSVAFAQREELTGQFLNTSRAGYHIAQDISSYSLTAISRAMAPLMEGRNGSILTLSYLGGERVVPHYNVMGVAKAALEMSVRYLAADLGPQGIRVNAISAGPIKTLAGAGVGGMSKMIDYYRANAPLRRATDQEEVGEAGLFLVSNMARGITGEVIHVDSGFHVMAFAAELA